LFHLGDDYVQGHLAVGAEFGVTILVDGVWLALRAGGNVLREFV